jgi:multiple sugar transport system substrate-binding protein
VDREDYLPLALRTYQVKTTQAAIPYDLNSAGIYLNRTHFQQAGVALPTKHYKDSSWTATDLLATAQKLTRAGAGAGAGADRSTEHFGYFVDTWIARWFPFLWGNGGDVFDSANDPKVFTFISKETEQTMQWLVDLRFQHQVSPQPADLAGTNGIALFKAGKVAMLQENMSLIPDMNNVSGLHWDAAPVSRGPKGRFTRIDGAGLGIHPGSQNVVAGHTRIRAHAGAAPQVDAAHGR